MRERCPDSEKLSALIDGVLRPAESDAVSRHAEHCPLCAERLAGYRALGAALGGLRETRCEIDLSARIGPRLEPRQERPRAPRFPWLLVPQAAAAAGIVAAGFTLGLFGLSVASGATTRPAAMAAFDPAPPGALCPPQQCFPGRLK